MTTRTGRGRVPPRRPRPVETDDSPISRRDRRGISGEDLAPVKARVLLMLSLTATSDRDEMQRMFSEY
jgi:L-asparaginase/Glu-tRNA(Gln) amidotransferase subunit D